MCLLLISTSVLQSFVKTADLLNDLLSINKRDTNSQDNLHNHRKHNHIKRDSIKENNKEKNTIQVDNPNEKNKVQENISKIQSPVNLNSNQPTNQNQEQQINFVINPALNNTSLYVEGAEGRYMCVKELGICQEFSKFWIHPLQSFSCDDEYLQILVDLVVNDQISGKQISRQGTAFLPIQGKLQNAQIKSTKCQKIKL